MSANVPVRIRVTDELKRHPEGLSCVQLEELLGVSRYTIGPVISKMFMYGGPVEKLGPVSGRGPGVVWRLKELPRPASPSSTLRSSAREIDT